MSESSDSVQKSQGKRVWSGGGYAFREGIELTANADGLTIECWYDGGIGLEVKASLTWAEVDALRGEA